MDAFLGVNVLPPADKLAEVASFHRHQPLHASLNPYKTARKVQMNRKSFLQMVAATHQRAPTSAEHKQR